MLDLKKNSYRTNIRLTSRDIAAYCQVSKSTVLEWIKSGRLKAFSLPSGHYRICLLRDGSLKIITERKEVRNRLGIKSQASLFNRAVANYSLRTGNKFQVSK
jgi:excisionase family DNA binding protein